MFYNFMINSQSFSSPMSTAYYFEKCFLVIPPLGEKEGQRGLEWKNVHLQPGQGSDQVFSPVEQAFVIGDSLVPGSLWLPLCPPARAAKGSLTLHHENLVGFLQIKPLKSVGASIKVWSPLVSQSRASPQSVFMYMFYQFMSQAASAVSKQILLDCSSLNLPVSSDLRVVVFSVTSLL